MLDKLNPEYGFGFSGVVNAFYLGYSLNDRFFATNVEHRDWTVSQILNEFRTWLANEYPGKIGTDPFPLWYQFDEFKYEKGNLSEIKLALYK